MTINSVDNNNSNPRSLIQDVQTKEDSKEQPDSFGKEVFDENVLDDNLGSLDQEMIDAVNQMTGVNGGYREFLELEINISGSLGSEIDPVFHNEILAQSIF